MVDTHRPPRPPRPPIVIAPTREPLAELDANVPIVLLPVRVETRWFPTDNAEELELGIRIFPDEIHLAPTLGVTAAERQDVAQYLATLTGEGAAGPATAAAYVRLVEQYGTGRAGWLVRVLASPSSIPDAEDAELRVNAMPDRWYAILRGPNFRAVATGAPIVRDLQASPKQNDDPSPATAPALGKALAWITDFEAAKEVGMAMRVRVNRADAERLDEIIVLGVHEGDPQASATMLGELVARHAAGDGASLLPWGTPTNRGSDTAEDVARERGEPGAWRGSDRFFPAVGSAPLGDAARVVSALGIDGEHAQDLVYDGIDREAITRAMHAVLWPATWGYYLEHLANQPATTIAQGRALFVDHVRPTGAYPALRVRSQPYGILPATSLRRWTNTAPRGALAALLVRITDAWRANLARVPRLVGSADIDKDLVAMLRRLPASLNAWLRSALDREAAAVSSGGLFGDIAGAISHMFEELERLKRAMEQILLGIPGDLHVTNLVFEDAIHRVTIPFVAPINVPLDAPLPRDYLTALATASVADIAAHRIDGADPRTLLYLLARHATSLVIANAVDTLPVAEPMPTTRRVAWHARPGVALDHIFTSSAVRQHRANLRALAKVHVRELNTAFAGCLDAASHRLDAWVTALASERLASLRGAQPHASYVGGWAYLENPRPKAAGPTSDGFVHAPSIEQARTAGVLRAAYEAHRLDDQGESLAIDLSADRVREARWLLDGVRAGRPLHRLLGDRIEQSLIAHGHADKIDDVRRAPNPSAPLPDLVDGWWTYQSWSKHMPTDAALEPTAKELIALVDSVADLLLADTVHHATSGNLARAAASLDALERGELATPDPHVDRSAADGRATRWRVVLALPEGQGWPGPARPRAVAAPRLDAFAARVLGDPRTIKLSLHVERDGAPATIERTLADLDLCALDVVLLAANGDDRALRDLAAASVAGEGRVISIDAELDVVVMKAAALARLFRAARAPVAGDLGAITVEPVRDRSSAITSALAALISGTSVRLGAAALLGPALAADLAGLRASTDALIARAAADPRAAVLGELAVSAPVGSLAALTAVAAPAHEIAASLSALGRARVALEPLDLLLLVAPDTVAGKRARTSDGVELFVFGDDRGQSELLVIDGWSELAPATQITSGVAFPFDAPRGQPPQSILIAVPPPQARWGLGMLESIVDETIDAARVRMIAPEDVHGQLLPALFVADDPDELTPSLDLTHVIVTEVFQP